MTEAERRRRLLELARQQSASNPTVAEAIAKYLQEGTPLPSNVAAIVAGAGIPLGAGEAQGNTTGQPTPNVPNPGPERAAAGGVDGNTAAGGGGASQGARGGAREYGPQSGGSAAAARQAAGLPNNGAVETAAQAAARAQAEAANAASNAARGSSTTGPSGGGRGTSGSMDSQFDPSNGVGDDTFMRFMLQEAGMNPDILTESSKAAVRGLMPVAKALRNLYGAGNGGVGGGITDFLKGFAQQFTSGGDDFFGNVQKYARDLQGNGNFQTAIGNLKSQEAAQQMYGNLLPLLYAGSNPLYGQAASDTFERTVGAYKDADLRSPKPGNTLFTTWLDQQAPQMTPFMRGIFGR